MVRTKFFGAMILFFIFSALFLNSVHAADDFFRYTPDIGLQLPEDKIYPQGQVFLFSGYSPHKRNLEQIKQSGFTALGPVYKSKDDILLEMCKAMKMFCIYTVRAKQDDGSIVNRKSFSDRKRSFDWPAIQSSIADVVKRVKSNKTVCLWYISPEELRWWRKNELIFLKKCSEAIHKADDSGRPVWMYSPGHRSAKSLSKIAPYLDIVGKGTYTNYSGMEQHRIWVKWSIEQEMAAIKQTGKSNKIPLLVPGMFKDPTFKKDVETARKYVRHDTYLGLISGAKGVVVFSLWPRRNFKMHQAYLDAYCEIATEMMKRAKLNRYFLFGTPKNDLKMEIVGSRKLNMIFQKKHKKTYDPVNFANIALGNKRLLIVVNSAMQKTKIRFSGFPQKGVKTLDAFNEEPVTGLKNGNLSFELSPLEVKGFIFSRCK